MQRFRKLALAAAFAVLVVACASDTTDEPIDLPEITLPETTAASTVPETTTTTTTRETTTETTVGDTVPVPEETTTTIAVEPDTDTTEAEVVPARLVVYEGITSESRCAVAGAAWTDGQCVAALLDPADTDTVTFWHPNMLEDAYQSIDPQTVPADHWESFEIGGPWGFYNSHVFYHYNDFEDPQVQYQIMREAASHAVRNVFMHATDWVWFPYRYDVTWTDNPNLVAIAGTYPAGEQHTLLLPIDSEQREAPHIELPLPLPPPTRPTTPFAEPQWQWNDTARFLGRDCPPVEEIWDGYGSEVTDQCTLEAIATAVDWMWTGDAEYRQRAIRDGTAMADFLLEIDSLENPFLKAEHGSDSRGNGGSQIRSVYWAGHFPAASMIHVEWNPFYTDRAFTPEEQAAKDRYYRDLQNRGFDVPDEYFGDELGLNDTGWGWDKALIVRTADGTWRVSYRAVCYWYQSIPLRERLLCPDDPNPHFPDSAFFDADLYPPSHKTYYQDGRLTFSPNLIHQDKESHRHNPEYIGVPPS
ncbi:MAG: hypothetical protein KTV45_08515 [Acidimicrobiia bacterium]|nr:hypothetical protein [Acidimicrobiia bacterium]